MPIALPRSSLDKAHTGRFDRGGAPGMYSLWAIMARRFCPIILSVNSIIDIDEDPLHKQRRRSARKRHKPNTKGKPRRGARGWAAPRQYLSLIIFAARIEAHLIR